tara:strand:- start:18173 stop:18526 length:354 start_codon:yes stop_codon:yes gene_type:complete
MNYVEKEIRPWGRFIVIEDNANYKIKKIEVESGQRLSYQYHNRRSEVWTIIKGVAQITIDGIEKKFNVGDTIVIPVGVKHRVKNIGKVKLIFIEVQTGEYFGEDDIVRLEDDYNRIK